MKKGVQKWSGVKRSVIFAYRRKAPKVPLHLIFECLPDKKLS